MGNKVTKIKYYLKKDGRVSEITKEERDNFIKYLKKEKMKYLCPECKVSNCEKIIFTDINQCEGVELGLFEIKYCKFEDRRTIDKTFNVYECKKYDPFLEVVIRRKNKIEKDLTNIDEMIKELYMNNDSKSKYTLKELLLKKEQKLNLLQSLIENYPQLENKTLELKNNK